MSFSFFTAVTYDGVHTHYSEALLEKVDDYFFLGGKKARVIRGNTQGASEGVSLAKYTAMYATIKKISYCTVIIPAIVLILKVALRSLYHFHLIQKPNRVVANVAQQKNGNIPPNSNAGDGPRPPSSPPPENRSLPTSFEPHPPPYEPGYLPVNENDQSPCEAIALTADHQRQLLVFDQPYRLTTDEVAALRINPTSSQEFKGPVPGTSYQFGIGFSSLREYQNSFFEWKTGIPEETYSDDLLDDMVIKKPFENEVTCRKLVRNYPELPLNTPVRLLPDAHEALQLTFVSFENGLVCGTSQIEEYKNSQINWREADDGVQGGTYTRTLKPQKSSF